jgi:integrase/recombinase XerD
MLRQPAKVLELADVRLMLEHVRSQRYPERNRVMVLLSFKAGRARHSGCSAIY